MKKLLLTLGSSIVSIVPLMTLVACGNKTEEAEKEKAKEEPFNYFKLDVIPKTLKGTTLSLKIDMNKERVNTFTNEDVKLALESIANNLIYNIKSKNLDTNLLAATEITFDHQIMFEDKKWSCEETQTEDASKITIQKITGNKENKTLYQALKNWKNEYYGLFKAAIIGAIYKSSNFEKDSNSFGNKALKKKIL